jgi:hypothetical protein
MKLGFYSKGSNVDLWRDIFTEEAPDIEFLVGPDWGPSEELDYALVWNSPNGPGVPWKGIPRSRVRGFS